MSGILHLIFWRNTALALAFLMASAVQIGMEVADVGGYHLHALRAGFGRPPVVFVNGMGEDLSTWNDVEPNIAKLTETLLYDRGGLGKSEAAPGTGPRDANRLAEELHRLLKADRLPSPYVLVGQSLGGAIVQVFAFHHPREVAGLIFVDPGDGRLDQLLRSKLPAEIWSAREKALSDEMPKLPAAVRREYDGLKLSGEEASAAFPLPVVPTTLLTGTKKNPDFPGNPIEQDLKLQLHKETIARIPGVKHILVPESRHYIQNDAPAVVITAVRDVIEQVRANRAEHR
jgi:pimeloyl-ACP methyl ester carboxylesterase